MMSDQQLKSKQQGLVLFIAMIALVVMSLAAVALIRSVDTNTKIAGNLAFKQSALTSANRGVESAIDWLALQAFNSLDTSNKTEGYYAVYGDVDQDGTKDSVEGNLDEPATLRDGALWVDANSAVASGAGIADGVELNSQNTIRYIIERMCERAVAPAESVTNKCLFGSSTPGGNEPGEMSNSGAEQLDTGDAINPMYRVTVRVTGPKNTESYTQAYVF